jgi:hypothetical protein
MTMPILRPFPAIAAALLALLLVSCNGTVGNASGSAPTLRVVNLAYGAPYNFDVLAGSATAAPDLGYGQASTFATIANGTISVVFEPTGTTTAAITASVSAANGSNYSVLALQGSSALTYLTVARSATTLAGGQTQISIVNAAPAVGILDFYFSGPTDALPAVPSQSAIAYSGDGTSVAPVPLLLTSGDFRIRAVRNGDATNAIVFDSGPVTFDAGATPMLVVVPVTGSASPVAITSVGADSTVTTIGDQRVQVRVGNFAPANVSVDTYFDQSGTANTVPFQAGVVQGTAGSYQILPPGAYHASFTSSNQTTELIGTDLSLAAGTSVSVFAIGIATTAPTAFKLLAVRDDLRAPATGMAKLRIMHLAPDMTGSTSTCGASCVDLVTLTTTGSVISIGRRLIVSQPYAGASLYATLAPGTYTVAVVPSGNNTPVLPSSAGTALTLTAGTITTLVLDGCQTPGSGICATATTPLQFMPFTD